MVEGDHCFQFLKQGDRLPALNDLEVFLTPAISYIWFSSREVSLGIIMFGNQQPMSRVGNMGWKSFGSLTGGVLAMLILVIAPISFSEMCFLEPVAAQTASDRKAEADLLIQQSIQLYRTSRYQEAIQLLESALRIYREIKDRNGEATALLGLGALSNSLGQYQRAINFYQQSLAIQKQINDHMGKALSLNNLGFAYNNLGQYQKAIDFYQQSLAIQKQIGDHNSEVLSLNNLGLAYDNLGQYRKAIDFYQQSLTIQKQIGDHNGEARSLNNLGSAYNHLGQYQKAIDFYQQSLVISKQISDHNGEAISLNNLGSAYNYLGQYLKAIDFYQQSLTIQKQIGDRNGEARSLNNLGSAYNHLGQYQKAIDFYQQSLAITKQIGDRAGAGTVLSNLGSLLAHQKQPELAIVFYKQSVNTYESIRKDITGLTKAEKESYLNTIAKTYRDLADLLLKQGRILEAQQVLELLKVEEIRAYTRNTRAIDEAKVIATNPTETKTADKHNSLIALGLKLDECEQQTPQCSQLPQLREQRKVISREYQQVTEELIANEISNRKGRQDQLADPDQTGKIGKIVSAQPNTVLIYSLILKDKIWILWASKGGITKSVEVPNVGLEQVSRTVLKLRNLLQSPKDLEDLQQTSKQLREWLIPKELQAELKANEIKHLIFVPDSVTRYIPMGVLFDGKKYLIENYTISTIITAGLTDTTSRLPIPQNTSVLAAGLSQGIDRYSPLPNVLTEINAIVRTAEEPSKGIYEGIKLLDRKFTKDSLENNLGKYAIAHIATHGKFVSGNAAQSFLVMGDGKTLPIPEIAEFRNLDKLHLVVLSACQTALGGENSDGTEISGISYYFLKTGAAAVIASLWEVSDDSTSLLMQQFYNNLAKSTTSAPITKAEAMRQAQLSLLQKQITAKDSIRRGTLAVVYDAGAKPTDNYSHPYYWSPFILIGNGW